MSAREHYRIYTSWSRRLKARRALEHAARARHVAHPTAESRALLNKRKAQVAEASKVVRRHDPRRTIAFDGVPVFAGLAWVLADARAAGVWHGTLQSADRRRGVAERFGKHSQYWLYMAYWVWHLPNTNPANRPGQSTHELASDSVAYKGPVGRPLTWWKLGLDVSDATGLLVYAQRHGLDLRRPYPHSASEEHHLNFYKSPLQK